MAPEQKNDHNGRVLKDWAPLVGLGLCTTWLIYLGATQFKRGFGSLDLSQEGLGGRILLAPVESLGATSSYLLLTCLASLCYLIWSKKRVDQLPRRAIGLPLLLLALSVLSALVEGDSQTWGGSFGGILERSFLFFGKPLAIIMALGLFVFGLIMSRDWFFYDSLRRLVTGGAAAPAFALGMGSGSAIRDSHQRSGKSQSLQIATEPGDDLDASLDFDPAPFAEGLTALAPANEDDDDPLGEFAAESDSRSLNPELSSSLGGGESGRDPASSEPVLGRFEESETELSNPPLTPSPEDRKKLPENDDEASAEADDSIEDFLAEESSEETDGDEALALDELPELDWSRTLDEPSDAELFAELNVPELEATEEVAKVGKESEMFASTETPVLDEPVLGWDEDEDESEDVDWDDSDDSDDDEDDFDDDDDDDEEDEDEEDEDDFDDDDEDGYEDDYGDDDGDDDEDYRDSRRDLHVAAQATEAAPAASISFSLTENELEELFEDDDVEAPAAEAPIVEPAALFPALDVDEEELFELDADDSLEAPSWDSELENPEVEIQSLLFPEEGSAPVEEQAEAPSEKPEKSSSPKHRGPRAVTPSLLNLDEDWAPWGEDSAPARPAAMMAVDEELERAEELLENDDEVLEDADAFVVDASVTAESASVSVEENAEFTADAEIATELADEGSQPATTDLIPEPRDEAMESALEAVENAEADDEVRPSLETLADEVEMETEAEFVEDELEFDPVALEELELEEESPAFQTERASPQAGPGPDFGLEFVDPLYERAAELCLGRDTCRISFLQRNLDVDFARAAALIERMESEGLVGPYSASGHHEILVTLEDWLANR